MPASVMPDGSRPRGRPRPQETIDREKEIVKALETGPATRNELAARLGLGRSLTYLALRRLREQGITRKCAGDGPHTVWGLVDGPPCQ